MSADFRTCMSEHVEFTEKRVPAGGQIVDALAMHCLDCGKYAMAITDGWPGMEPFIAKGWNAHHAHQMAEYIAAQEQRQSGAQ